VHYSTDYVFADTKQTAYSESDATDPVEQLSVYGQSKLAGEKAIKEAFDSAPDTAQASEQDKFSRYLCLKGC
jgi:dTDP-4-dehydrorhamnose reductase